MSNYYQQARLTRDHRFDGKFFIAVKTTHIFCRPICPANPPLEKNVEYFQLAEQAILAGYRPCLRCRPDSAPHSYAWQGIDTTVNRAAKLLREQSDINIDKTAIRLGISTRYLRQLFQQKIGMSPKQYQLFNKILFAKQLLHQSDLSIEEIAQSCGFSCARLLQQNLKKFTRFTPSQLRQNKSIKMSKTIKLNLAFRPPYNWSQVREFLLTRAINNIESVSKNSYSRNFISHGSAGNFTVSYQNEDNYLALEINLEDLSQLKPIVSNITRIFDLHADSQVIQQQLSAAGIKPEYIQDGLRLAGVWDTFEAGCRAILGQQISVKAAINLLTVLCEKLGTKQQSCLYFPCADSVANSSLDFLNIPQSRKQTLITFAQYMTQNSNQIIDNWIDIKGIGPWTIAYAKMRGESLPDIWLDSDLVIKKQLAQHKINPDLAKPWRSYLTLQLWNMA
ncbi:DNA-3-methyladenine glycosylase 2 family protein [Paraglaciecola sp. L3A3]|uniref:DNA-3-methyladenine glycosylase 2 family protein n=1 Tax=Paraglaciecola sp. L3A3 TaxID=2686358 RepID=UPI00131BA62E|nr:Ada metal-binding domain-containing protein [Paraglaciecola sp. L3A3]